MSLPKEPRQKMINLMYLVLTALLALNVSSEILNAFKTVDTSLQNASKIVNGKSDELLKSLDGLEKDAKTHDKAVVWNPLAKSAKAMADAVVKEIEDLKLELKKEAGLGKMGKNEKTGEEQFKEDDLEAATRLFTEPPPIGKGQGPIIKQKIEDLKAKLLALNPEIGTALATSLPIDMATPGNKDWSQTYFHMTPTVAALTILSKFQNDIQNSASQVVEFCHSKVGEVKIVFDNYIPLIGTNSTYLMPNDELRITAGIGAYSKAANTTHITVDGSPTTLLPDGTYEYKTKPSGVGPGTKRVHIEYFNQATGKPETKDVEVKYTVGSPTGVTASAEKVNVLYLGLENPIKISGGTAGAEKIQASTDNGTIVKGEGGLFIAKPASAGKSVVTVTVDGKSTPFNFPVKRIPSPTPMVGQYGGGNGIPVNAFKANVGIRADMGDFVFEGVKYNVVSYTIVCTGRGFESTGPKYAVVNGAYFTPEVKGYIEMCKAGSSVLITDITVEGPDGRRKLPGSMAFNLTN